MANKHPGSDHLAKEKAPEHHLGGAWGLPTPPLPSLSEATSLPAWAQSPTVLRFQLCISGRGMWRLQLPFSVYHVFPRVVHGAGCI